MSTLTLTQFKIYYKTKTATNSGTSDTHYFILDVAYDGSNKVQNIFSPDVSPKGDIGLIVGTSDCGSVNLGSNQITLFMNQIPTLNGISTTKIPSGSTVPYEYYALTATTSTSPGTVTSFKIQGWNGSAFVNIFTNNSASISNSDAYVYADPATTVNSVSIDANNVITDLPNYVSMQNPILADLINLGYTRAQIVGLIGSSTSDLNAVITYVKNNTTILAATLYKLGFSISELYNNGYTATEIANYNGGNYIDPDLIVAFTQLGYVYYSLIAANIGWDYPIIKSVLEAKLELSGAQTQLCAPASGIPINNLKNNLGYSYLQIYNNGNGRSILSLKPFTDASALYNGGNGLTVAQLYGYAGVSPIPVPNSTTDFFSLAELILGVPIIALKQYGFTADQLYTGGCNVGRLYGYSGFPPIPFPNIANPIFSLAELISGVPVAALKLYGFSASQLKQAGSTARELYNSGANGYYTLFELKTAFTLAQMYNDDLGISKTVLYNKANVGTSNASELTSYLNFLYTTPLSGSFFEYPITIYSSGSNGWTLSDMRGVASISELITGNSRNTASNLTTVGGIPISNFTFNNVNGISLTDIKTAIRAGQLFNKAGWSILQLYGSDANVTPPAGYYSLAELYNQTVDDRIPVTALKTHNFTSVQLYNGGNGLTIAQLYGAGIPSSSNNFIGTPTNGFFDITDFKTHSMPASALKSAGFTSVQLYNGGATGYYSIAQLYGVGVNNVTLASLNPATDYFAITDFKNDSMPASALKSAGFTSVQLHNGGANGYYSIAQLYGVGVNNVTLASLNPATGYFAITDFKNDIMPASALKSAGFTSVQLYNGGANGYYSIAQLYGVGVNNVTLASLNPATGYFAITDFKNDIMPASALKSAGFIASQVYNGGYNTLPLLYGNSNNAQGSPASGYYPALEICAKIAYGIPGISIPNLVALGFNTLQIFNGGYSLVEMEAANVTPPLTPTTFTTDHIPAAQLQNFYDSLLGHNYNTLLLLNDLTVDYTVAQLIAAGFSLSNFHGDGVSAFYFKKEYPTIAALLTAFNISDITTLLSVYSVNELTRLYLSGNNASAVPIPSPNPNNYSYYTISDLKLGNVTPDKFRTSPLTFYPSELIAGGYTLANTWRSDSDVTVANTNSGYFTAADFKADSNITMDSLVQANFKPSLLLSNAYSLIELWNGTSGQTPSTYYSAQKFSLDTNISVASLLSANFKASLIHDSGNGYSVASLYPTYSLQRFFDDGITIAQLYSGNMLTSSATPGSFTALQLYNVGSANSSYRNFASLKNDGRFSAQEIYNIMQTLNYTYQRSRSELLSLGYTDANISLLIEPQQLQSVICFPAKTPVKTDQGYVHIDKIDKRIHTIRGEKIVAITKTVSKENHLVCIKKNALARNMPSEKTYISKNHCVLYKGKMVEAKKLVALLDNGLVEFVEYTGETLYNVLLEEHSKIIVNNMICETLHPFNKIAIFHTCTNFYNVSELEQQILVKEFNKIEKEMMNMRR